MRWLGNYFDQVGREQMAQRISGRRGSQRDVARLARRSARSAPNEVLWVETGHPAGPRAHGDVDASTASTSRARANSRNLDAARPLALIAGDVVTRDRRRHRPSSSAIPAIRDSAVDDADAHVDGRRDADARPRPVDAGVHRTRRRPTHRGRRATTVVFVETTHPDRPRSRRSSWKLDGADAGRTRPTAATSTSPALTLHAHAQAHAEPATVGARRRCTWTIDNVDADDARGALDAARRRCRAPRRTTCTSSAST